MTLCWRPLWSNLLVTAKIRTEKTKRTVKTKSSSTTNSGNCLSSVSSSGDDKLPITTSEKFKTILWNDLLNKTSILSRAAAILIALSPRLDTARARHTVDQLL
jgi:hypothetical protein